jgi:plasmid stabilization system protein ParE
LRRIRWTPEASEQLEAAVEYIQRDNPNAALNAARAVIARIEQLAVSPGIGRPGEAEGTRELVCPPYIVVYRYTEEVIQGLSIWHGAQDWRQ